MSSISLPSKEEARLCASVVKEIAQARGMMGDPAAIGQLTAIVAKLYSKGKRDRNELLSRALETLDISSGRVTPTDQIQSTFIASRSLIGVR